MTKVRLIVPSLLAAAVLAGAGSAAANTVPNWFWHWAAWYQHGKVGPRPAGTPSRIPAWSWRLLRLHAQAADGKKIAARPAARPPAQGLTDAERSLLAAVNAARAANGLAALGVDSRLQAAARAHTQDLLDSNAFTHDFVKNGVSYPFATWIGWYYRGTCAGENLALGTPLAPATAVQMWLGSPGHRANLLSSAYHTIGIALQGRAGRTIATTDFGGC